MSLFEGGWLPEHINQFHEGTKKWDPVAHYAVEWPLKGADWLVGQSSQGLSGLGKWAGVNTHLPDMVKDHADENFGNFGLSATRAGAAALASYGGIAGAGAYGAGGAAVGEGGTAGGGLLGGAAGTEGAPTALGYGLGGTAGYTAPGTGGAAIGGTAGGLGGTTYLEQGGGQVADKAGGGFDWLNADGTSGTTGQLGQGGTGMDWQSMMKQFMNSQNKGGGSQRGGRQNLPFMENEKSDQQKLAELLQKLQEQNQGAA